MGAGMKKLTEEEWWLDDSALPSLIWARLTLGLDGWLVDCEDGTRHIFLTRGEALTWLREDEYETLTDLRAQCALNPQIKPPC